MSQDPVQPMFCYTHPQRETLLRCNQCDRPMCTSCAVRTPTGYRCKECVRGQQKIFNTAQWWDYPVAVIVGGVLSYLGSLLTGFMSFFTILLAPVAGMVIAEAVRLALRKRRSKNLPLITAIAVLVGALISPLSTLVMMLLFAVSGSTTGLLGGLLYLIWPAVYAIVVASTVYYRLKGIRI